MFHRLLFLALAVQSSASPIERIWLTFARNEPSHVMVNWETPLPAPSKLEYGPSSQLGAVLESSAPVTLHHLEVKLDPSATRHHYRVSSGPDISAIYSFKALNSQDLRIVLFADRGYARDRDLNALLKDDPHLILTCGDNVASLHENGLEGTLAFSHLIESAPKLFQSAPFMPILGNHDRELTPRGSKPPTYAVYDVEATAFRSFFPLPDTGWRWRFDLPAFRLRLLALDASHVRDHGNTWQSNHPVTRGSEQHQWYTQEVARTDADFVLTLNNEQNAYMRSYDGGVWSPLFKQSSAVITGYGYYGELAEVDGLPYFNTCLKGDGDLYKDPRSVFITREDNYLLLTATNNLKKLTAQFKNLQGNILNSREILSR